MLLTASSQNELRSRYGVFGHAALTSHTADFFRIPGTQSCCAGFTGGSGTGLAGGLLAEFPLTSRMHVGARLALLTQPFSMTTPEPTRVIVNGNAQDGAFEHRLTGNLVTLGLEPLIAVRLFSSAYIHIGGRLAIFLSSSYEQRDVITLPEGTGTFLNANGTDSRKRTRNEYAGTVPETSLQISPMVGVSYELPLNNEGTLLLVPEAFYQLGVMSVMSDSSWKASSFRAGIALKWSPAASKQQQPVDPTREPAPDITSTPIPAPGPPVTRAPITPANVLTASLTVNGVDAVGIEAPIAKFVVEEYSSTLMTPLLPYVFFDENSDRIPLRYQTLRSSMASSFDIDRNNSSDKLTTYHHLLNVVGKRMQMYPNAKIVVTGNNMDVRDEKGNTQLSQRRAESVKRYLTDVWGIADNRITTDARLLPSKAANTLTQDGSEENRRAELFSSDASIMAPIITSDTLRTSNPPAMRLRPTLVATAGVASWKLTAMQNNNTLRVFQGVGSIPAMITWSLDDEQSSIPRNDVPVRLMLTVVDNMGATATTNATLNVELITIRRKKEERKGDKIVDRFSLILFDVRSSDLETEHNGALDIIRQHIEPTSTITITGYTDRLGEARFNQQLAESRSAAVAIALKAKTAVTKGIGQADLYDSTLPEGRLYTRTVNVVIETPVKN